MTAIAVNPEATTGSEVGSQVTDKKGYAAHLKFSVRQVDNFLAAGLPHCKVGKRRVRIFVAEADQWFRDKYFSQRLGRKAVIK